MGYYAVGIGGTGAKCIESMIHLAAAGLVRGDEKLYLLYVDPDKANGSLGRAGELMKCYRECRENRIAGTDFLKNDIEIADPNVWTPLSQGTNSLEGYFRYHTLPETASHLFDVLYTPQEKNTPLDKGFRGHPSIGAAVLATAISLDNVQPWQKLWQNIEGDLGEGEEVKVILFGSIFGGTGASGLPTIARILKNKFGAFEHPEKIKLSAVLMLPYFSFERVQTDEMKADSHDFLLNTQAALQYYYQQDDLKSFDYTYLIGCGDQRMMRTAKLGGEEQKNDPHYIELYAALAALDFFARERFDSERTYNVVACQSGNALRWTDLPYASKTELESKVVQMLRFSFAYLSNFYPMLQDISRHGSGYRAPWYVDFFEFKNVDVSARLNKELKQVHQYCRSFLEWLANVEYSVTGEASASRNLVSYSPYAYVGKDENNKNKITLHDSWVDGGNTYINSFKVHEFEKYMLPGLNEDDSRMYKLWERMCESYPETAEQNAWDFINHLYRQCGKVE
jgi:hypothetical protein